MNPNVHLTSTQFSHFKEKAVREEPGDPASATTPWTPLPAMWWTRLVADSVHVLRTCSCVKRRSEGSPNPPFIASDCKRFLSLKPFQTSTNSRKPRTCKMRWIFSRFLKPPGADWSEVGARDCGYGDAGDDGICLFKGIGRAAQVFLRRRGGALDDMRWMRMLLIHHISTELWVVDDKSYVIGSCTHLLYILFKMITVGYKQLRRKIIKYKSA